MKEKQFLLVKLGDAKKGWIPSKETADSFMENAKAVGLDKKFNIIMHNYAIDFKIVDNKAQLEEYGIQIVDEKKFKKYLKG